MECDPLSRFLHTVSSYIGLSETLLPIMTSAPSGSDAISTSMGDPHSTVANQVHKSLVSALIELCGLDTRWRFILQGRRILSWTSHTILRTSRGADSKGGNGAHSNSVSAFYEPCSRIQVSSRTVQGIASEGKVGHTSIEVQDGQPKDNPKRLESEAKVWALYLDLAEGEARDRAALWNTALDSLLIFVSQATIHDVRC